MEEPSSWLPFHVCEDVYHCPSSIVVSMIVPSWFVSCVCVGLVGSFDPWRGAGRVSSAASVPSACVRSGWTPRSTSLFDAGVHGTTCMLC